MLLVLRLRSLDRPYKTLRAESFFSGDKLNRDHRIFDVYFDPCRARAGEDQNWSMGESVFLSFCRVLSTTDPIFRWKSMTVIVLFMARVSTNLPVSVPMTCFRVTIFYWQVGILLKAIWYLLLGSMGDGEGVGGGRQHCFEMEH